MKKFFKGEKCGGCKGGFTLIELLVVIAIIAILATIVIVTYNSLRKKARDAERRSEITQLQKLVEIYMVDSVTGLPVESTSKIITGSGIVSISDYKTGLATGPSSENYYYIKNGDKYAIGAHLELSSTTCTLPSGLSFPALTPTTAVNYCLTS